MNTPIRSVRKSRSGFKFLRVLFPVLAGSCLPLHAAQSWRHVTVPTVAQAAASFAKPPMAYRAIFWDIWHGPQTKAKLLANIEQVYANGGGVVMINNSRDVSPKYLSPEYMDLVKFVVQECKKRGMKVWIEGDCGYPDGFAGGLISEKYPKLGMQGIVADASCTVAAGKTLSIPVPPDTLGIVARARPADEPQADSSASEAKSFPIPADGVFKYSVPRGGAGVLTIELPETAIRYDLTVGEPFSLKLPPDAKTISLTKEHPRRSPFRWNRDKLSAPTVIPVPSNGHLQWKAPAGSGTWKVTFIRHAYRTSPTRNDNGIDGGKTKDTLYTLIDYLDPKAVDTYLKVIYDAYQKAVGDEFGKTILGFRGDETDFTGVSPWTPGLLETFRQEKGYDFQPYIPLIFGGGPLTPAARRAKADYWDVWSGLFRDNFFKRMQEWCTARHMEWMVHLNHEEMMMSRIHGDMIKNEGSFWRDMRYVGVPGVDNLDQVRPGVVANFPKLAASAAHVTGRPLVWDEEGSGFRGSGPFVVNYQLVRGINYMNIRGINRPDKKALGWYVSRAEHLLALGRPGAQIALLHPTESMWMGDRAADTDTLKIVTELLDHQIDFDHIGADELASVVKLEGAGLKNLSGQTYRAVIVPTSEVIQKADLDRLRAFASAGGKVIFVGKTPTMVVGRTFLHAGGPPDLSFATVEPKVEITSRVIAALPPPEVKLDKPCPSIKYIRRVLADGDVYFFFNESDQTQSCHATLAATGKAEVWDAENGTIQSLSGVTDHAGSVTVPLTLKGHEARFIVLKR